MPGARATSTPVGEVHVDDRRGACSGADLLVAFRDRQPAPHAVGLVHGQRVIATLPNHLAAPAYHLGPRLAVGPCGAAFPLGVEEQIAVHAPARATDLPLPDLGDRQREPANIGHANPLLRRTNRRRGSGATTHTVLAVPAAAALLKRFSRSTARRSGSGCHEVVRHGRDGFGERADADHRGGHGPGSASGGHRRRPARADAVEGVAAASPRRGAVRPVE